MEEDTVSYTEHEFEKNVTEVLLTLLAVDYNSLTVQNYQYDAAITTPRRDVAIAHYRY